MAIIQPVDQFLSEVNREECRKPVLYKIMGKAMKSVSKAAFWVNFIYGDLSVENAMRVGYACPHVHPEMENDPEKLPLIIRDQVFDAIDRSPSGNVIAGAQGTIEGQLKDHVTYPDKKVHLYDETVDRFIGNITPEKEAECIALTEEYRTNTEELRRNRKLTLQMIMAHHPVDCHHCLRILPFRNCVPTENEPINIH